MFDWLHRRKKCNNRKDGFYSKLFSGNSQKFCIVALVLWILWIVTNSAVKYCKTIKTVKISKKEKQIAPLGICFARPE